MRSCAAYVRIIGLGVFDSLDAKVDVFPHLRRVRAPDNFVHAGLIGQPIADLKLHREHMGSGRRGGVGLLHWPLFGHARECSPKLKHPVVAGATLP